MRLREYFTDELKLKISNSILRKKLWSHSFYHNKKQTLDKHQVIATQYALDRNNSYLALEQGLGKTIVGSVVVSTLIETFYIEKVLLIVPPRLITNWVDELNLWCSEKQNIFEYRTKQLTAEQNVAFHNADIVIVADSILDDVTIPLTRLKFDLVITDEADRFCNYEAQRTLAHETVCAPIKRRIRLSGTPERGSPKDLFTALQNDAHNIIDFIEYFQYTNRYCDAYYNARLGVYNDSGSSNEDDLHEKLKQYMLVMESENHLDLPPLVNEIVTIDKHNNKTIHALEKSILKQYTISELIKADNIGQIATFRKLLALEKLDIVAPMLLEELEHTSRQYLIFGIHREMLEELHQRLSKKHKVGLILGGMTDKNVEKTKHDFKTGKLQHIVANIHTMVGHNLQNGTRVKFIESSWRDRDNAQAVKRAHRRGQNRTVVSQHYVISGSLDEYVLRRTLERKEKINKVIKENSYENTAKNKRRKP